uniref:Phosducin domain-containing protein n=1 Tax=Anopheles funestus TaxID=62324 RepID=A0A182RJT3_ANOFN
MIESTIAEKQNGKDLSQLDLDELDELEDSEDEAVLQQYRQKRIAEMQAAATKARYGTVREISGQDYVEEVTKAGEGIYVSCFTFIAAEFPLCALINQHLTQLAIAFPMTKVCPGNRYHVYCKLSRNATCQPYSFTLRVS